MIDVAVVTDLKFPTIWHGLYPIFDQIDQNLFERAAISNDCSGRVEYFCSDFYRRRAGFGFVK